MRERTNTRERSDLHICLDFVFANTALSTVGKRLPSPSPIRVIGIEAKEEDRNVHDVMPSNVEAPFYIKWQKAHLVYIQQLPGAYRLRFTYKHRNEQAKIEGTDEAVTKLVIPMHDQLFHSRVAHMCRPARSPIMAFRSLYSPEPRCCCGCSYILMGT